MFPMLPISPHTAWQTVAVVLMFVGLMGAVLPLLPGASLIFAGALLWGWAEGFAHIGTVVLIVLGVLALIAESSDWVLSTLAMRKAGATWKTVIGAIIGGLVGGGLVSGVVPLVGSVLGVIGGACAGVIALEYIQQRELDPALKVARNYCLGSALSVLINFVISMVMLGIFVLGARG